MLAACGARGVTVLDNPAREPEIVDLQGFLRQMGAKVSGAGTGQIVVEGGAPLHPGAYSVMADRIVAATCLCAVAAAGGEGELRGAAADHLTPVLAALRGAGCDWGRSLDGLWLRRTGPLRGIGSLCTGPYPAFPTDAQPLLAAVLAAGQGRSRITETIFDHRFRYTQGLCQMGAQIQVQGDTASITGRRLHGARVQATDLRGGAALTIAALSARGSSQIWGLEHVDRGYEALERDLAALGGQISRRQGEADCRPGAEGETGACL